MKSVGSRESLARKAVVVFSGRDRRRRQLGPRGTTSAAASGGLSRLGCSRRVASRDCLVRDAASVGGCRLLCLSLSLSLPPWVSFHPDGRFCFVLFRRWRSSRALDRRCARALPRVEANATRNAQCRRCVCGVFSSWNSRETPTKLRLVIDRDLDRVEAARRVARLHEADGVDCVVAVARLWRLFLSLSTRAQPKRCSCRVRCRAARCSGAHARRGATRSAFSRLCGRGRARGHLRGALRRGNARPRPSLLVAYTRDRRHTARGSLARRRRVRRRPSCLPSSSIPSQRRAWPCSAAADCSTTRPSCETASDAQHAKPARFGKRSLLGRALSARTAVLCARSTLLALSLSLARARFRTAKTRLAGRGRESGRGRRRVARCRSGGEMRGGGAAPARRPVLGRARDAGALAYGRASPAPTPRRTCAAFDRAHTRGGSQTGSPRAGATSRAR